MEKSCKIHKVKVTYPVDELIKCLSAEKAFGFAAKYVAHSKLMKDLNWSLNLNIFTGS